MIMTIISWLKGMVMAHKETGRMTVSRVGQMAMLVNFVPKSATVVFTDDPPAPPPVPCEPPCENEDSVWVDIECLCDSTKQYEVKITWDVKAHPQREVLWEIIG